MQCVFVTPLPPLRDINLSSQHLLSQMGVGLAFQRVLIVWQVSENVGTQIEAILHIVLKVLNRLRLFPGRSSGRKVEEEEEGSKETVENPQ